LIRRRTKGQPIESLGTKLLWEREESLSEEIRLEWHEGKLVHQLGDVAGNLKIIMRLLSNWSRIKSGAVTKELETLRKRLEELSNQT
jgi:hypothetical protein